MKKPQVKKLVFIAIAALLAAVILKSFFSPPVLFRLAGDGLAMEGPTGRVFRVPLTGGEKARLALGCLLSRKVSEEKLQRITGGSASDPVLIRLSAENDGPSLFLSYHPDSNMTVIHYAAGGSDAGSAWAVRGRLARNLYTRWKHEFDDSAD